MYGIEELIALAAEKRASDVHLIAGLTPKCRIDGRIETLTDGGLTREECEEYGRQLAGNAADQIEAIGQLDFSASFAGRRLRVNLFRQQGALSAAIRLLGSTLQNLSELGLPEALLHRFPRDLRHRAGLHIGYHPHQLCGRVGDCAVGGLLHRRLFAGLLHGPAGPADPGERQGLKHEKSPLCVPAQGGLFHYRSNTPMMAMPATISAIMA